MKTWLTFVVVGLALSLAACGNGSLSTLNGGNVGGTLCPAAAIVSPTLAYPAPNATNVPITTNVLVFYAYGNPQIIPQDIQMLANGANAVDLGLMTVGPSVIPTPTAPPPTPAAANVGSVAIPAGTLARGVAYTISVQSPNGNCPLINSATLGTFTTSSN